MQKEHTQVKQATGGQAMPGQGNEAHKSTHATGARSSQSDTTSKKTNRMKRETPVEDSRLKAFFIDELKDILWAEQKLVKTLPKLQQAATSKELQNAFSSHLKETEGHVQRLEKVFEMIGESVATKKCEAIEGITEEGKTIIDDTEKGTATRDVGLIMAGQKAEHYEIATYGSLIQLAHVLGYEDAVTLLEETLQEEKNADDKLTDIAENHVNYDAASEKND